MRDLPAARRRRRGGRRARALRDPRPRRLPHARVLRGRPRRGVLAPRRRRDRTRSSTRPAAGSSRPCARRGPPARTGSSRRVAPAPRLDARRGHDDVRGQVRLRARPRDRARVSCGRSARPAASRPGSARTRSRPSSTATPTPTSTSCSPRCCRRPRSLAEAADVFLERGAFDAAQARRYLEACRAAGLALRLHGDQFTESGAIPLAIELGARSVDHLEATGPERRARARRERRRRRAAARERALPRPPDAAGARARRRRRRRRARDRLQPGQRVLREPPARLLARCDPARARRRPRRSRPAP